VRSRRVFAEAALFAYVLALSIGIVAGLRAMTAPAVVSWAAHLGWIDLEATPLAFLGYAWTPWLLTLLAVGELITDQLPSTPNRTVPIQLGTRIVSGALTGAALSFAADPIVGAVLGVLGAIIGTLGGRVSRAALAKKLGKDRPAAFIEDAVAVGAAILIVSALS
jgi:uncharacterized membrane protein